jgi:hypothetical protein
MILLKDVLGYAWRGSGKYVLVTCVVLSVIADLAGIAPLIGLPASVLIGGYFCAIYFQLIQSSAVGGKEAPEFPETSSILEDIVWPLVQVTIVAVVSFGPLLAYSIWASDNGFNPLISWGLVFFGVIYFPMAMLAVVVLGYTGALSPHIVLPSIIRGGWLYWGAVLMLASLYGLSGIIDQTLEDQIVVGHLVMAVVSTYTFMTNARLLGVIYRERQDELGWL